MEKLEGGDLAEKRQAVEEWDDYAARVATARDETQARRRAILAAVDTADAAETAARQARNAARKLARETHKAQREAYKQVEAAAQAAGQPFTAPEPGEVPVNDQTPEFAAARATLNAADATLLEAIEATRRARAERDLSEYAIQIGNKRFATATEIGRALADLENDWTGVAAGTKQQTVGEYMGLALIVSLSFSQSESPKFYLRIPGTTRTLPIPAAGPRAFETVGDRLHSNLDLVRSAVESVSRRQWRLTPISPQPRARSRRSRKCWRCSLIAKPNTLPRKNTMPNSWPNWKPKIGPWSKSWIVSKRTMTSPRPRNRTRPKIRARRD